MRRTEIYNCDTMLGCESTSFALLVARTKWSLLNAEMFSEILVGSTVTYLMNAGAGRTVASAYDCKEESRDGNTAALPILVRHYIMISLTYDRDDT